MDALANPSPGFELCYECDGIRFCRLCRGSGQEINGERCFQCTGTGWCITCGGDGELPLGTKAGADKEPTRRAVRIGWFRELGHDTAWFLEHWKGRRDATHTADVARYLRAGKIMIFSPGFARDIYDRSVIAGTHSMRTDGDFVWPDVLAHYVEKYGVELPPMFEAHMAAAGWNPPQDVDIHRLGIVES